MLIKHLFHRTKLESIFTPSNVAKLTYVERDFLEDDLSKNLRIPGMQIVLYGHSGCGKTTLLTNMLEELNYSFIKTSCIKTSTVDQLILEAFDYLDVFYETHKKNNSRNISVKIKNEYFEMKSQINKPKSSTSERIVPIQLTPQKLAELMGQVKCLWIIEDFHKVEQNEKIKLAQILKVFMDMASEYQEVKIVCIGAVKTARELLLYDSELRNRIVELYVPLLKEKELIKIVNKGSKILNICTYEDDVQNKICYYSNNLAAVCHQLCYDICHRKNFLKPSIRKRTVSENDFQKTLQSYLRGCSDSFTYQYENISKITNGKLILQYMIDLDSVYFSFNELYDLIDKKHNKITKSELSNFLQLLITIDFDEVLRFEKKDSLYLFSNPFFKAFLKMKFASEDLEKAKKRRKRTDYKLSENANILDIMFSKNLVEDYHNYLNIMMHNKMQYLDSEIKYMSNSIGRLDHKTKYVKQKK